MADEMYAVSGETLTGIANAIRSKTGSDYFMTVASMASAIDDLNGGDMPPKIGKIAAGTILSTDVSGSRINIPHNLGVLPDIVAVWQSIPISNAAWGSCWCCLYKRIPDSGSTVNVKVNTYPFLYLYKHITSGNILQGVYNSNSEETDLNVYRAARGGADWANADANGNPFYYVWAAIKMKED